MMPMDLIFDLQLVSSAIGPFSSSGLITGELTILGISIAAFLGMTFSNLDRSNFRARVTDCYRNWLATVLQCLLRKMCFSNSTATKMTELIAIVRATSFTGRARV